VSEERLRGIRFAWAVQQAPSGQGLSAVEAAWTAGAGMAGVLGPNRGAEVGAYLRAGRGCLGGPGGAGGRWCVTSPGIRVSGCSARDPAGAAGGCPEISAEFAHQEALCAGAEA